MKEYYVLRLGNDDLILILTPQAIYYMVAILSIISIGVFGYIFNGVR